MTLQRAEDIKGITKPIIQWLIGGFVSLLGGIALATWIIAGFVNATQASEATTKTDILEIKQTVKTIAEATSKHGQDIQELQDWKRYVENDNTRTSNIRNIKVKQP